MKLGVFYPWSSPFVYTGFADSMLNLERPDGYEVEFFRGHGWCPARRHADGCEKALRWGADLICCVGTDQVHPRHMLKRLVELYLKMGGVITALVPFRGYVKGQGMKPFQPLAWKLECDGAREFRGTDKDADMMRQIVPDGTVQEVNFIGSGVLLFDRQTIMSLKRPWFYEHVDPKTWTRFADMDSKFVWRLQKECGVRVWADTSLEVKHLNVFEIDETYQQRFADWAEDGMGSADICPDNAVTATAVS